MRTVNEEQLDAILFDQSLLSECLDMNLGQRIDHTDIGARYERNRRLAEVCEDLKKAA